MHSRFTINVGYEECTLHGRVNMMQCDLFMGTTRTVRGSDYSPAVELLEQKDKLATENWRD